MEKNLDRALSQILGGVMSIEQSASLPTPQIEGVSNLGALALEHYKLAKDYLRLGKWAEYGRELENLEKILTKLSEMGE